MSEFDELRAFVAVAESLSVTKAAARLNTAPSAVSRRVKDLEARLGAQLLVRTTRRMSLTDAGRTFLGRATQILDDLENAKAEAGDARADLSGTLRVAAPLSFGVPHVGPLVAAFMHRHPNLKVDLDLSDRRIDLIEEGVDLALRIGDELDDSSLVARRLCAIRGVVCASPGFLASHGTPHTPAELEGQPGLVYGNLRSPDVWRYTGPDGKAGSVKVTARLTSSSGEVLNDAAVAGLGLVREPTFIVHRALQQGLLTPLFTDHIWQDLSLYALYPQTRFMPARVRAFLDVLIEAFAGVPYWESADPVSS